MVQKTLSSMDSDEVNSISDTIEATQVAEIIETTYFEIINDRIWPHMRQLTQLTASGDSSKPVYMQMDDDFQYLEWVKYNTRTSTATKDNYTEIERLDPEEFLKITDSRASSDSTIETIEDDSGVKLLIKNNTAPTYWTSFDDEWIVFDSYDSDVDTTLQSSKTKCMAYKEPTFTLSDSFIPDLPSKAFPYLLAESKSVAFNEIKQTANTKEEQKSRRQRTWLAQEKYRQNGELRRPGYGRNR